MSRIFLAVLCCLLPSCAAVQGLTRLITAPIGGLMKAAPGLGSTALSLGMMGAALAADEQRTMEEAAAQRKAGKLPTTGAKEKDIRTNVTAILEP